MPPAPEGDAPALDPRELPAPPTHDPTLPPLPGWADEEDEPGDAAASGSGGVDGEEGGADIEMSAPSVGLTKDVGVKRESGIAPPVERPAKSLKGTIAAEFPAALVPLASAKPKSKSLPAPRPASPTPKPSGPTPKPSGPSPPLMPKAAAPRTPPKSSSPAAAASSGSTGGSGASGPVSHWTEVGGRWTQLKPAATPGGKQVMYLF